MIVALSKRYNSISNEVHYQYVKRPENAAKVETLKSWCLPCCCSCCYGCGCKK